MATTYKLPKRAYLDDTWFRSEQERLVGRTWTLVASTDELPDAGDYVAAFVADAPIVVVRGGKGEFARLPQPVSPPRHGDARGPGQRRFVDRLHLPPVALRPRGRAEGRSPTQGAVPESRPRRLGSAPGGGRRVAGHGVRPPGPGGAQPALVPGGPRRSHRQLPSGPAHAGRARPDRRPLQLEAVRREPRRRVPPLVSPRADARRLRPHEVRVRARSAATGSATSRSAAAAFDAARLASGNDADPTPRRARPRRHQRPSRCSPTCMFATSPSSSRPTAPCRSRPTGRSSISASGPSPAPTPRRCSSPSTPSSRRTSRPARPCSSAMRSPSFSVGPLAQGHEHPITVFHDRVLEALADPA